MPVAPTTCPMDCPDTCAIEVQVEGGVVRALGGAADHPATRGFLCSKVAKFHRRLDHPDRLLRPMRRVGAKGEGRFEPISWTEAIDRVTRRFREVKEHWGGEAILPFHYGGSNGKLSDELVDHLYFARLGATRLAKTICAAPSSAVATGMYGKMPGVDYVDYPAARAVIVWGANPKTSSIHLVPFLKQARAAGAVVAVVDPQRNFSEREVDLHLAVRPGTDLPVALAMIDRWRRQGRLDAAFLEAQASGVDTLLARAADWSLERAAEEAGVAAGDVARLADAWADASPALIRTGWGLERNANGGQALAAILAMPALLGKFGQRGGGFTMSNSGSVQLDRKALLGDLDWHTRVCNMTHLGAWIAPESAVRSSAYGDGGRPDEAGAARSGGAEAGGGEAGFGAPPPAPDPPVKALFVYNANPVATVPDQRAIVAGLEREDLFTVVFEQVMTDTARYADLLLPATTFLEQWEVKGSYGAYGIGGIRPAVPRCGEARPNVEVFAELGRAMGFDDEPFHWDEQTAFRRVAETIRFHGRPVDVERLEAGLWVRPDFRPDRAASVAADDGGGTNNGERKARNGKAGNRETASGNGQGGAAGVVDAAPGRTPGTAADGGSPEAPVAFRDVFPRTPDGKVHLAPACLGPEPYAYRPVGDHRFPLALVTPGSHRMITSSMGEYNFDELTVTLHPQDAEARGIESGSAVRVHNAHGTVECAARVSDATRPGVASMPKGAWRRTSRNGATSTALTPSHVNVVGDGACFNDARVEVERLS